MKTTVELPESYGLTKSFEESLLAKLVDKFVGGLRRNFKVSNRKKRGTGKVFSILGRVV